MVLFSLIEIAQWQYLYHDRLGVLRGKLMDSFLDKRLFCGIGVVDACAILRAAVVALFVERGWVDDFEI